MPSHDAEREVFWNELATRPREMGPVLTIHGPTKSIAVGPGWKGDLMLAALCLIDRLGQPIPLAFQANIGRLLEIFSRLQRTEGSITWRQEDPVVKNLRRSASAIKSHPTEPPDDTPKETGTPIFSAMFPSGIDGRALRVAVWNVAAESG